MGEKPSHATMPLKDHLGNGTNSLGINSENADITVIIFNLVPAI